MAGVGVQYEQWGHVRGFSEGSWAAVSLSEKQARPAPPAPGTASDLRSSAICCLGPSGLSPRLPLDLRFCACLSVLYTVVSPTPTWVSAGSRALPPSFDLPLQSRLQRGGSPSGRFTAQNGDT